jgi:release factor glutamine methyltransferase
LKQFKMALGAVTSRSTADEINRAAAKMAQAGFDTPRLDAEVMAAAALGMAREQLLTLVGEMPPAAMRKFADFVRRRIAHEPVAYIIGHKEFFSLELEVNSSVLIPRPESEVLTAAALEWLSDRAGGCHVLDMCTGSGAIAIAIAVNCASAQIEATDASQAALAVAKRNAERHRVAGRIRFECCDLWPKPSGEGDRFDLVVANPPYIADSEMATLASEVTLFEPGIALAGGPDGLRFYRLIAQRVRDYLKPGCRLMVEMAAGQGDVVAGIFQQSGARDIKMIRDLAGHNRVVSAWFVSEQRANR